MVTLMRESLLYLGQALAIFGLAGPLFGLVSFVLFGGLDKSALAVIFSPLSLVFAYLAGLYPAIMSGAIFCAVKLGALKLLPASLATREIGGALGLFSGLCGSLVAFGPHAIHRKWPLVLACAIAGIFCGMFCRPSLGGSSGRR